MFIGIDVGTSNSVIAGGMAGQPPRLFKTADGGDVLPSALFVDKHGMRLHGRRALEQAILNPDAVVTGFKRLMGTATPIALYDGTVSLTPEECTADILKTLLAQVKTETGADDFTQVVITIPAAFNQMQAEATQRAAERAGLKDVKLLQEPVAAAIAAAYADAGVARPDGQYLIYDLGGGTFDLALAESRAGTVKVIANQGINMLGGRDFDRKIVQDVIRPWLHENFDLPEDILRDPKYKRLSRVCHLAAEKAKIDLSTREVATIFASDDEIRTEDLSGAAVFLDVRLTRERFESLISDSIDRTIAVAQLLLEDQNRKASDMTRIVFVGGPSKIPLVRQRVAHALGIAADLSLDPMTCVAMGAAYYAAQQAGVSLPVTGGNGAAVTVATKAAPVITIPAAKTIAVKVRDASGDEARNRLAPILEAGTKLPAQGTQNFTAAHDLTAGGAAFLSFELFQLEFPERLELNLCVGAFRLGAADLPAGVSISAGDGITFRWHMNDSGILTASVVLPDSQTVLNTPRFYAPQQGQRNYAGDGAVAFATAVLAQGDEELTELVAAIGPQSPRELDLLRHRLQEQREALVDAADDAELLHQISEEVRFIRQDIARMARRFASSVLQRRTGRLLTAFNRTACGYATDAERTQFDQHIQALQNILAASAGVRADALKDGDMMAVRDGGISSENWYRAERTLLDMRQLFFAAAWRNADYVAAWYARVQREAHLFPDQEEYKELCQEAEAALASGKAEALQAVMNKMMAARINLGASDSAMDLASISLA